MKYVVTDRCNPSAQPFLVGSGGYWYVEAISANEAIEVVSRGFWKPLREQSKKALVAYPLLSKPSDTLERNGHG